MQARVIALPKDGALLSPAWLDFVRALPCAVCGHRPRNFAHHFPPKGRGVVRDDMTMPACEPCHRRCHGNTVVVWREQMVRLRPVTELRQRQLVEATRLLFLECATKTQFESFARDRATWLEHRHLEIPW
jgi:hypothetical protein